MAELKAAIEISAQDRFSAAAKKMADVSQKLAKRLEAGQRELVELGRQDAAVKKLQELTGRVGATGAAMDRARRRTAALGRQVAAAAEPPRHLTRAFDEARRASDRLQGEHREQRDSLRRLRAELRGAGLDTRQLGEAQRGIARDLDRTAGRLDRLAQAADRLGRARTKLDRSLERAARGALVADEARRFGQGALRLVTAPLERTRQVERSKGELASLGLDRAAVATVARRGREVSRRLAGVTTAVFTSAAYDIKSGIASLDAQGVADLTELAALTARATKGELAGMTELFASAYGTFKAPLYATAGDRDFGAVLSAQLAKAVQQFKTDGGRMQQAIESMGSGLAGAGVSMADQFAALGMLQQKMSASEAGTALNALERSAAGAQERFAKLGQEVRTLDDAGNLLAPQDLLAAMQREFGAAYTSEIGARLQQAFGSEEAVKFFKALWGQQDALRANAAALEDAAAQGERFTRTMQAARDANLDARLQVLQQRWDVLQERLGDRLIPVLEWILPKIEFLVDALDRAADRFPTATQYAISLTGGIALLAAGIAPVITAIVALGVALQWLKLHALKTREAIRPGGSGGALPERGSRPAGWRGLAGKLGGAKSGGWRGLAGKIGGFGASKGRQALGFLKGKGGLAGAALGALALGGTLLDGQLSGREKAATAIGQAGGLGGALGGAALGAALGSAVPLLGTALGGLAGGILGGLGGDALGVRLGRLVHDPVELAAKQAPPKLEKAFQAGLQTLRAGAPAAALALPLTAAAVPAETASLPEALRPPAAAPAAEPSRRAVHHYHAPAAQIIVHQAPGEDAEALADRILRELERRRQLRDRTELSDAL